MKKIIITLFIILINIGFVIGADTLPTYVRPLTAGDIITNQVFTYTFNFSNNPDCSDSIYDLPVSITTDQYGIGFSDLDISGLNKPVLYQCEYRDGSLRKVHNISSGVFDNIYVAGDIIFNDSTILDSYNSTFNQTFTDGLYCGADWTNLTYDDEADGKYVNKSGDTMTGNLTILTSSDSEIRIEGGTNMDACLRLREAGDLGLDVCYDGSGAGSNNLVIQDDNGNIYMTINRDSGIINFYNNTIFNEEMTVNYINATGTITAINLNVSYIYNPFMSGYLDIRANPWYLGGTDLQIAENLTVDHNIYANNVNATVDICIDGGNCLSTVSGDNSSWNQTLAETLYVPYTGATSNLDLGDNNFSVDGSSLFVDSGTGNVGIGTTAPGKKFVVSDTNNYIADFTTDQTWGEVQVNSPSTIFFFQAGTNRGFIGTRNNQPLHFAVNAVTRLIVDTNGNVGIGTIAPQNKLDVAGAQVIGSSYAGTNTAPTDGLLVEGRVGIGTTTPDTDLHVTGGVCIDTDISCVNPGDGNLYVEQDIESNRNINATTDICITGGNCLSSVSGGSSSSDWNRSGDLVFLNATKNFVGIGVDSPLTKLHITNTAGTIVSAKTVLIDGANYDKIPLDVIGNNTIVKFRVTNKNITPSTTNSARFSLDASTDVQTRSILDFRASWINYSDASRISLTSLYSAEAGVFQEALTIFGHNIGIGTTTPQNKLDVEGGAVIGSTYAGTNTAPTDGLLVEGNVGIGTASPDAKLEINVSTIGLTQLLLSDPNSSTIIRSATYGGNTVLDFSPMVQDPTASASFRFFRNTVAADSYTNWFIGDGTATVQNQVSGSGDSYFQRQTGNLGIGTDSPSEKLDVDGNTTISGSVSRYGFYYSYMTAEHNTAATTYELLDLDTQSVMDAEFYSESAGTVTVSTSGLYLIDTHCISDLDGGTREDSQCAVFVNTTQRMDLTCGMYARETAEPGTSCGNSGILDLGEGSTVSLRFQADTTDTDCGGNAKQTSPASLRMEFVRKR